MYYIRPNQQHELYMYVRVCFKLFLLQFTRSYVKCVYFKKMQFRFQIHTEHGNISIKKHKKKHHSFIHLKKQKIS